MRIQVPLHVGLEVELLVAHFTLVSHVPCVFPLVFFQVMPFPVNLATVRKLTGVFFGRLLVVIRFCLITLGRTRFSTYSFYANTILQIFSLQF